MTTHYVRDDCDRNLVDCEVTKGDVRCVVDVEAFAALLLDGNQPHSQSQIIQDFKAIQEIRQTWFELTPRPKITLKQFVTDSLQKLARDYDLCHITD
jgi:hypothetical protein